MELQQFVIKAKNNLREALEKLNTLQQAKYLILFVLDENDKVVGSLTDGDIRRALVSHNDTGIEVGKIMHTSFRFIREKDKRNFNDFQELKDARILIVPVIAEGGQLAGILDLRETLYTLPVDALLMAGGKGTRLRPLTEDMPKPLLQIGNKAVIDWNIGRLNKFGVDSFFVSINYLKEKIIDHFESQEVDYRVDFIHEDEPLGTIGAARLGLDKFEQDTILMMNSDLITNLNYEEFYHDFVESGADMSVVSIPYSMSIPYAVLESEQGVVNALTEKPTYTYQTNGGIYLFKKELIPMIPHNEFYNATDFMEDLIEKGHKVTYFPHYEYWLDIGKHEDFNKAQSDIEHLNLN